jgi:hypothetical protein
VWVLLWHGKEIAFEVQREESWENIKEIDEPALSVTFKQKKELSSNFCLFS